MRFPILTMAVFAFVQTAARAADAPPKDAFAVLESKQPGPRITPFLSAQLDLAWSQDEARRVRWASVRTEGELLELQSETRARLLALIGGLPETKSLLNARVTGTIQREGYRIEKIVFESLPGFHVTALLYVPDGVAAPRPAVLVACGHSPLGKAFPNYQQISGRLALRGYVVLCWDPVGQGERSQYWDAVRGRSRYNLVCGEHAVLGNLALLAGTTLNRFMVWDAMRALDYLLTRPEVDARRISITGTSGGGLQSTWIGALDTRVGVIAPSCFPTALPMRMANRIFDDPDTDPEQDPYRLVSAGIDHAGLLLLAYPRPFVVSAAVKDFVPIEGTRRLMRELAALYRGFGKAERVELNEGYHEHRYSDENQEAAFAFLDRFNGLPPRHGLESIEPLEPEALRCTPSGQVRVDLPGRSLPELIREQARDSASREPLRLADLYFGEGYPGVREWPVVADAGQPAHGAIVWESAGRSDAGVAVIERYRLRHSDRLVIPLVHVYRKAKPRRGVLLTTGLEGKAGPQDWPGIEAHLAAGWDVVSFDARGLGETRLVYKALSIDDPELAALDEPQAYRSAISGVLANHVYNALLTGRPYFLQMIEDAEIVARFVHARLGAERIAITGPPEARLWAVSAAQLIPGLELFPGEKPQAWPRWVEDLDETWPIHYLLPGGALVRE